MEYNERQIEELKNNPVFVDWTETLKARLVSIQEQLEVAGKETIIIRDETGKRINFVAGHDWLQGAVAQLRFVLQLTDVQQLELTDLNEGGEDA